MVRMNRWCGLTVAGALAVIAPTAAAQDASPAEAAATELSVTSDSAPAPKKKKGLFGKMKEVAGNKVVKTVAKTALCNMVPGGQMMAGALEAATSDDAGAAVSGAAATGNNCMPGMAGMAGGVPHVGAAAAAAGMSGGVGAVLSGGVATGFVPGLPRGMPATEDVENQEGLSIAAGCMGLTVDEYLELVNPTHGQSRPLTKDDMKRQTQLAKKVDARRYQACMVQQMSAPLAQPND